MNWRRAVWLDGGNAVVEFIVVAVGLQLAMVALVTGLGSRIDSQSAAAVIARQALRDAQLNSNAQAPSGELANVLRTFGLAAVDYSIQIDGACPDQIRVSAIVRGVSATAAANCAN